jgi:hypothetical protein
VDSIRELAEALYREEVAYARAMPPEEKLIAGIRLFESACRIMADGIRNQYPDADEERVQQILTERLALVRRLEGRP